MISARTATAALMVTAVTLPACRSSADARPNIVVIFADDQGYGDLGSNEVLADVRTPHLDALAADGVRCTRGYVTAPQCVPSRAGMMTGRYQTRFGVDANKGGILPLTERTVADLLHEAGYRTGMVGKWHLDGGRGGEYGPGRRGFEEYFNGMMLSYEVNYDLQGTRWPAPRMIQDPRYRIDVQTDAAIAFLKRPRGESARPFFLYVAYYAPHVPLDSPEPYMQLVSGVADQTRRKGLAAVAAMDHGVGRIRRVLRDAGLEDNTIVFFLSDNGAPIRAEVWGGSLNGPLTGEKGMLTDGGVRVPFLVSWKGKLRGGAVENRLVSSLDVAATALALGRHKAANRMDGTNLIPFLTGEQGGTLHPFLYWRWRSQAAIFDGKWKLVFLAPDRWLLFDHSTDAPERVNVADTHPAEVARLRSHLEEWASQQLPPGLPSQSAKNDLQLYHDHMGLFVDQGRH